jgi:hypothetical protein
VNLIFQCVANAAFYGKAYFKNHKVWPSKPKGYQTSTGDF